MSFKAMVSNHCPPFQDSSADRVKTQFGAPRRPTQLKVIKGGLFPASHDHKSVNVKAYKMGRIGAASLTSCIFPSWPIRSTSK